MNPAVAAALEELGGLPRFARAALVAAALAGVAASPAAALTFGPEIRLTTDATECETGLNHGAVAVDSWGRVTAAWAERDGARNNFRIHTRTRDTAGVWEPQGLAVDYPESYAGTGLGAKFPALVHLPGDTLLMVWHDYRLDGINHLELYAKTRPPGGAWGDSTTELRVTTSQHPETGGDNSYLPNLALAPDGTAHLAWYDFRYDGDNAEILFKSRDGGAFDTTPGDGPDLNVSANAGDSNVPALAPAPDGSLHLAWRDNTGGAYRIRHRARTPAGAWGPETTLSPPAIAADGVTLAVAADGTVVAAWSDARDGTKAVFVRERSPAGIWGAPHRASPGGVGAEEPALAIVAGVRHLVWQDARVSVFNRELFHQESPLGAVWDSTGASDTRLSDGAGKSSRPSLAVDGAGRLLVVWQDARHGATELYFREGSGPVTSAPGAPTPAPPAFAVYPNPFSDRLRIDGLPADTRSVTVVDLLGRRVRGLAPGTQVTWDGRTDRGFRAPAGVYLVTIRGATGGAVRRVVRTR